MASASVNSPTLDNAESTSIATEAVTDTFATDRESAETPRQSIAHIRRESNISEIDPNAFKITILLASSGYRTQISINRSFMEKASAVEGDSFLVSQLKNAIWKDWPTGTLPLVNLLMTRLARPPTTKSELFKAHIWWEDVA